MKNVFKIWVLGMSQHLLGRADILEDLSKQSHAHVHVYHAIKKHMFSFKH